MLLHSFLRLLHLLTICSLCCSIKTYPIQQVFFSYLYFTVSFSSQLSETRWLKLWLTLTWKLQQSDPFLCESRYIWRSFKVISLKLLELRLYILVKKSFFSDKMKSFWLFEFWEIPNYCFLLNLLFSFEVSEKHSGRSSVLWISFECSFCRSPSSH